MPDLATNVTTGAPDHPGIHNAERTEINARIPKAEKGAANGVASLGADGLVPTAQLPAAAGVADATTTAKGIVQLAGDLGGTAAAPTVPGLAGKVSTTAVGAVSGVASLNGAGRVPAAQVRLVQTTQTAAYTLVLADDGTLVEMNVGTATTLTVPTNASVAFTIGTVIGIRQYGAGQVTVTAATGVTIVSRGGVFKTAGQYAEATLTKRAADEWVLTGDIAA